MRSVSRNNFIPLRHEADYCKDLARKIEVVNEYIKIAIFLSQNEKIEAIDFLRQKGINDNDKKNFYSHCSLKSAPNWIESKYLSVTKKVMNLCLLNFICSFLL